MSPGLESAFAGFAVLGGAGPVVAGLVAALLVLALRGVAWRRGSRDRARLAEEGLLRRMVSLPSAARWWARASVLSAGAAALAAAAAGSGAGRPTGTPVTGGPETVLVLDASNSMLAEDVRPSRLLRQRELARALVGATSGQAAVVYFAGRGYVLSPLTTDLDAVLMFVEAVRPASVGRGGSALTAGIEQALDVLAGGRTEASKRIVLFSDGEETAGQGLEVAAARAREAGVAVHAVGIGTPEGARIPLGRDAAVSPFSAFRPGSEAAADGAYLRGPDGEVVVTRLEEGVLRELARATGGSYAPGTEEGVRALARRLRAVEPPSPGAPPAGATLLLLAGFALLWVEGFLFRSG